MGVRRFRSRKRRRWEVEQYTSVGKPFTDYSLSFNLNPKIGLPHPNRLVSNKDGLVGQEGKCGEGLNEALYGNNERRAMVDRYRRLFDHNDY